MKLKVFQAGAGDALLIESTSAGAKKRILVDAGEPHAYAEFLAGPLHDLPSIDVLYVSHIDRDHIGGVLEMLDAAVEWRIHDRLKSTADARPRPATPEPPAIGEIWHNAFFDDAAMNVPDIVTTLAGTGSVVLGHADASIRRLGAKAAELALSVGDAIQVSRRIGSDQLGIDLNPAAGGEFMLVKDGFSIPPVGPLDVTIVGPTPENLQGLIDDWNEWLDDKAGHLAELIDKHEVDEDLLASDNPLGPLDMTHAQASDLATSSQRVTPPNVASLMVMIEEDGQRVLLTGDGDDVDIIAGLETQNLLAPGGWMHVDVLKVPHHGAANSFSDALARRVIADHYVFCGNGHHDNPELSVVRGYVEARRALATVAGAPPEHRRSFKLWFNHSEHEAIDEEAAREAAGKSRDQVRIDHWAALETLVQGFVDDGLRPRVKARFLKNARSMTFRL